MATSQGELTFPSPERSVEARTDTQGRTRDSDQLPQRHVRVITQDVEEDAGEGEVAKEDEPGIG